jgi:hypothetical protein
MRAHSSLGHASTVADFIALGLAADPEKSLEKRDESTIRWETISAFS